MAKENINKLRKTPVDDERFLNIALNHGFDMGDTQDFIADYFQNLHSVKWNLKEMEKMGFKKQKLKDVV
jgi:hypothetical protein